MFFNYFLCCKVKKIFFYVYFIKYFKVIIEIYKKKIYFNKTIHDVIINEFCFRQLLHLIVLLKIYMCFKILFYNRILSFRLFVRLKIKCGVYFSIEFHNFFLIFFKTLKLLKNLDLKL